MESSLTNVADAIYRSIIVLRPEKLLLCVIHNIFIMPVELIFVHIIPKALKAYRWANI